jgi:hypothetical protein
MLSFRDRTLSENNLIEWFARKMLSKAIAMHSLGDRVSDELFLGHQTNGLVSLNNNCPLFFGDAPYGHDPI